MTTSTAKGSVFKIMRIRKQSILIVLSAIAGLIFPTASSADELTQQSVKQQVVIQAPASEVWAVVGDFFALDKWPPRKSMIKRVNYLSTKKAKLR
jgi:uncharacterized membrane protein